MFLNVFLKKCFHRNDAGCLKLSVLFSVEALNDIAIVYSNYF